MEKRNKSKQFLIRLTPDDYDKISKKATDSRLNLTDYFTRCALKKKIVVINGLFDFVKELKANGRNLNQLTTLVNMGKIQSIDLNSVKQKYNKIYNRLSELLECER